MKDEKTTFWRDQHLSNVELLHARYVTHVFARHAHDEFAIGVIERGAETFEYRHAWHIAPAGSVVLINPGEVHTGQALSPTGWTYRMLYPEVEVMQAAAAQITEKSATIPFFSQAVVEDAATAHLILKLHYASQEGSNQLERQSRLLWTLGQLISRHAENRPLLRETGHEHEAVWRVRDYLESCYNQNISLEELAQIANLSQFHFLRVFRRQIGLPPHSYLTQVRVQRAKRLLAAGWPIAFVASETGFVDQSHLTRHFKRLVGVTPGQYTGF